MSSTSWDDLPPIESYDDAPKTNGHASREDTRPFVLLPPDEFLKPGQAPEFIVKGLFCEGSVVGIVAPPEAGKSLLIQEIAWCVALGQPFHGRPCKRGLVVYLAGEGHHGLKSRYQALATRYDIDGEIFPLFTSKAPTSLIDPVEEIRVQAAIDKAVELFEMPLSLLIIDTLARFMGTGDESKATDMGAYLAAVDRLRGQATAVSLHHPGHGDATRGRGSSSWKAALDTEYSLANLNGIVTVSCQKMKDGPKPEPFSFSIETAPTLMTREDGSEVQSVLLHSTDYTPMAKAQVTGKAQSKLLAALEAIKTGPCIWTEAELREIGRGAGMHRNSARDAVLGLRRLGYLVWTAGGSRLKSADDSCT